MSTNDIKQNHKQYDARKKRIKKNDEYDGKIKKITNKIKDIDTKIAELQKLKNKKLEEKKSS